MVPEQRKHLCHGLLDQPVEHRRNAEQANASACFRDFLPAHRGRFVRSLAQGTFDLLPVSAQVSAKLRSSHAIHTGRPFIALHPFEGFEHVLAATDCLHEPVFSCRTFSEPDRYEFITGLTFAALRRFAKRHLHLHCFHTVLPLYLSLHFAGLSARPPFGPSFR